jgi:hypothetical protein
MQQLRMERVEIAAIGTLLGAVPVISCFLAGWWLSLPFVPEARIFQYALAGLLAGILIDAIFLRKWVRRAYALKPWVWMLVYAFYSIGMFGFFMGVPVFHVFLALPAGIFVGRWLTHSGADVPRVRKVARQTAIFTTSMLGLVCTSSAFIALSDRSTAANLQGMLGLPFQVTRGMLIGVILGGGALLLAAGWWLTTESVKRAYAFGRSRSSAVR